MAIDILAFGPHPDDAEIGCGGMLLKMKSLGYTTGIVDMTTGDMGWGDPQERVRECEEAAKILQLDVRENLDLGDCRVEDTFENRCKVAQVIRKHRPQILFAPWYDLPIGRGLGHNDHFKTGVLVSQGYNFSHLRKMPIEGEPWQARAIFYYFLPVRGHSPDLLKTRCSNHALLNRSAERARPLLASAATTEALVRQRPGALMRRCWSHLRGS